MEFINILDSDYLKEYFETCHEQWSDKKTEFELAKKLEKIDNVILAIGLIENNILIGFISLFKKDSKEYDNIGPWYSTMYVKTQYRNKGYSRLLNDELLKRSHELGIEKLYLKTTLDNYYEKLGAIFIENIDEKEKLYFIYTKKPIELSYEKLLEGHLKYGTIKEDIIKKYKFENIRENVVISSLYTVDILNKLNPSIEKISSYLYDIKIKDKSFSYIYLDNINTPRIIDIVISLGLTKCKKLLFIGTTSIVDKNIEIGNIIIPKYSIVGDGSSRYLNENLEDDFLIRQYPDEILNNKVINILSKENILYHVVPNYSIDEIFSEYTSLDFVKNMGCKTMDVETATIYKASKICNINVSSLLIINKDIDSNKVDNINYENDIVNKVIPNIINNLYIEDK